MEPRVAPLAALYDLNTDLLLNCLDGLSDAEAQRRLAAGGNSITFLAGHLTDTRHFLVSRLGHPLSNPLARYLADVRSIEDINEWPEVLADLTAAELEEAGVHRFPLEDSTRLGLIAYLVQHDSYHLGQIAFLRRQLGKPPMSYARSAKPVSSAGAA